MMKKNKPLTREQAEILKRHVETSPVVKSYSAEVEGIAENENSLRLIEEEVNSNLKLNQRLFQKLSESEFFAKEAKALQGLLSEGSQLLREIGDVSKIGVGLAGNSKDDQLQRQKQISPNQPASFNRLTDVKEKLHQKLETIKQGMIQSRLEFERKSGKYQDLNKQGEEIIASLERIGKLRSAKKLSSISFSNNPKKIHELLLLGTQPSSAEER